MRYPIWREGGAYGGCRDCFDAQLVQMIDTRALGADDPRKKAWVDARTYEWDVHYFYPMADEAAQDIEALNLRDKDRDDSERRDEVRG